MTTFQKPENVLKRADELLSLNTAEDKVAALDILQAAIGHKRFRQAGWTSVQEDITIKFVDLCVGSNNLKQAKDGLIQYRGLSQLSNVASLEKVICRFRDRAEEKMKVAKSNAAAAHVALEQMGDLEAEESPESLLLATVQDPASHDAQSREMLAALRFVWEAYKTVLDILRTNAKLERVYHETAAKAFDFCVQNKRPQEFKRLCEMLRTHYANLQKAVPNPKLPPGQQSTFISLSNPDTIAAILETRFVQLKAAVELELYREAYTTAEDAHALMQRHKKVKPNLTAIYFEKLAKIFWVSENYVLHAQAWLRCLSHTRAYKQKLAPAQLEEFCSASALSVLSISLYTTGKSLDIEAEQATTARLKRMTTLLGLINVPTRESLKAELLSKRVVDLASPAAKRLYSLIETDSTPLSLCQEVQPLLDSLPPSLQMYAGPIKRVVFHKLIWQLSKVYSSIAIDHFCQSICPATFLPWAEAEKIMVDLVHQRLLPLRLDYIKRAIFFGSTAIDPSASLQNQLADLGTRLEQAVRLMYPEDAKEKERAAKEELYARFVQRIKEETKRINERRSEIESRTAEREREKSRMEHEYRIRLQEARAREEAELQKREEEMKKKREEERKREEKAKKELEKNQEVLETIKKLGAKMTIAGKKVDELRPEDVKEIDKEELARAQQQQRQKERQERIKLRKAEAKKVDHLVRALREEEVKLLKSWEQSTKKKDDELIAEMHKKHDEEHREKFESQIAEKAAFLPYAGWHSEWMGTMMVDRQADYEERVAAQRERLDRVRLENKKNRAMERKAAAEAAAKAKRDEEERIEKEKAAELARGRSRSPESRRSRSYSPSRSPPRGPRSPIRGRDSRSPSSRRSVSDYDRRRRRSLSDDSRSSRDSYVRGGRGRDRRSRSDSSRSRTPSSDRSPPPPRRGDDRDKSVSSRGGARRPAPAGPASDKRPDEARKPAPAANGGAWGKGDRGSAAAPVRGIESRTAFKARAQDRDGMNSSWRRESPPPKKEALPPREAPKETPKEAPKAAAPAAKKEKSSAPSSPSRGPIDDDGFTTVPAKGKGKGRK